MLEPGFRLGAYRIVRLLGQGGMGCVYEAEHVELRVRRALKVFASESKHAEFLRRRFVAEGRILANLRHPRIVRVYDFAIDSAGGTPYFAMDLVLSPAGEPRTLEDVCRNGAGEDALAGWFRDVCEGLAYIHSQGVVHRDVSLDNILVDRDGRAVITDFGIARITREAYRRQIDVTKTLPLQDGTCISWGKGLYQAPELADGGEATPATDAYALGVLFFRILAGSWYTPAVRLEDALAGFDAYNWPEVIARLCAVRPEDRLGTEGIAGAAALLRKRDPAPRPAGRLRIRAAAAVAGAASLALLAAFALHRSRKAVPPPMASARPARVRTVPSQTQTVYRIVDVTNSVVHILDVTNTVYQIVPVTNRVPEVPPGKL